MQRVARAPGAGSPPPRSNPRRAASGDRASPRLVLRAGREAVDQLDVHARGPELFEPSAGLRVRIERPGDDPLDAGIENRLGAGRRAAVVRAGLHRHVERCAAGALSGRLQGDDLAVRPSLALVPALADDLPVADDDGPDHGVRVGRAAPALGELKRPSEGHRRSTRPRYDWPMSSPPKVLVPATNRSAPASRSCGTLSRPTPPSTWTCSPSARRERRCSPRGLASGMQPWPE